MTSYVERPALSTTITDVNISPKYNGRFDANATVHISLGDSLFQHLSQIPWVKEIAESDIRISDLIDNLVSDQDTIAQTLKNMDNLKTALPELMALLSGPRNAVAAEAFFDKWQPVNSFIYKSVIDKLNGGEFTTSEGKDYDNQQKYFLLHAKPLTLDELDDNDAFTVNNFIEPPKSYTISKRGGLHSSTMIPHDTQEGHVARDLAKALTYFDQTTLLQYLNVGKTQLADYQLYQELNKEITQYLRGYSRWSVTVLVANSGSHPISISPTAALYINSGGTYGFKGYTLLGLQSRAANGDLQPVTLEGGSTQVVEFVSTETVSSNTHWSELLSLFDSGARGCFLVVHPQSDFWNKGSDFTSPVRTFGSAKGTQRLTDKEIADHFAQ